MYELSQTATFIPVAILSVAILLYRCYQWLLPKPIPGIPYNKLATKKLFGDIPDLVEYVKKTDSITPWFRVQAEKLDSPIIQVWTRPFSKPWVVIYDFPESQDILMRRTKEFDRSMFFEDVFSGLVPNHHIQKKSMDPSFKHNRALTKDLMTPAFLNEVAAPQIYTAVENLIALWNTKMRIANGHPFHAENDVFEGALDVIFAATFGLNAENGTLPTQNSFLKSNKSIIIPDDIEKPVEFPKTRNPDDFEAILTLTDSLGFAIKSPYPRWQFWFLKQMPHMRKALKLKERLIEREVSNAIHRLKSNDQFRRCAVDDVLRRETALAPKEGRPIDYFSPEIHDELFGFLIAGHDTTSTTLCWAFKHLSDYEDVQSHFRDVLQAAFPDALAQKRSPTAVEITRCHAPYLDAMIEEAVRTSGTSAGVSRVTMTDTVIFGHHIPKGTDVFLMSNGPGFVSTAFPVNDADRHESVKSSKGRQVPNWPGDAAEIAAFRPERWLVKDENGIEQFDGSAGPALGFGLGPRGCFGRRLAQLEMRIILVMIIWNFRLMKLPKELNSYARIDRLTVVPKQFYLRLEKV